MNREPRVSVKNHWPDKACRVWFVGCSVCGDLFTTRRKATTYCRGKCAGAVNYYGNGVVVEWRDCKECGEPFKSYDKNTDKYCGDKCRKRVDRRNGKQVRRLRMLAGNIEVVNLSVLFERDGGRCMICRRKLNMKRRVPHQMAATVDHIIPLAEGGEHSYRNTQLACFRCNSIKGNRSVDGGEQLRLYG